MASPMQTLTLCRCIKVDGVAQTADIQLEAGRVVFSSPVDEIELLTALIALGFCTDADASSGAFDFPLRRVLNQYPFLAQMDRTKLAGKSDAVRVYIGSVASEFWSNLDLNIYSRSGVLTELLQKAWSSGAAFGRMPLRSDMAAGDTKCVHVTNNGLRWTIPYAAQLESPFRHAHDAAIGIIIPVVSSWVTSCGIARAKKAELWDDEA